MKKKFILLLLLFSLFFNIAHASIIALEDDCHHETAHEYVLEQSQSTECGDLCDMHHIFHFMAILDHPLMDLSTNSYKTLLTHIDAFYMQNIYETTIKPPIA